MITTTTPLRRKDVKSFDKISKFTEIKTYISHFKDSNKGQAAYSAGITLEEAKTLNWLKV